MLDPNSELWEIFTRKEEYSPIKLDKHDRFNYAASKYRNSFKPVVSEFLLSEGINVVYPDNKKFAVCLTHDIDDIYPPLSHILSSFLYCLKSFDYNSFMPQILWKIKGNDHSPYLNFKEIMNIEQKYDAKSSFYFITAKEDPVRFRYDIEEIGHELGNIVDNECEVGLHGGYYTYNSLQSMKEEKKRLEKTLGKDVIGYRNHYLRFKIPDTWELLVKAGFKYDTTLGYDDMIGFRNGMCHPFNPYNLNSQEAIDILEIPLIIMDGALFSITRSLNEAFESCKKLIDTAEKYNGVITLLWHNAPFSWPIRKNWKLLYEKILKYCYDKNAWMTSGEEIYKWWTKECKLQIYPS
ncbi:MAG: polysaccharide deacetylase family protein [Methanomethylovorans sp.]|jgi:peptidoglycan/xylan/chitin deacetylase (PgdA/CDA1 family)|nr:polysaccharide deacetylase family protein [Methanomethylovorans sp.]